MYVQLHEISWSFVFLVDGHGGKEVAKFVANWIPKEALQTADINDLPGSMIKLYNRYVFTLHLHS